MKTYITRRFIDGKWVELAFPTARRPDPWRRIAALEEEIFRLLAERDQAGDAAVEVARLCDGVREIADEIPYGTAPRVEKRLRALLAGGRS